jgi:signal transduction histidine kinase
MRLAGKIFLANSLVILVLAGIAAWSLNEVAKLSIADATLPSSGAEALRSAVSLREAIFVAKRVDMRSLVFGDPEYAAISSVAAARIARELDQLAELLKTEEQRSLLAQAATDFREYQAAAARTRELRTRGDVKGAEQFLHSVAEPIADKAIDGLDRLVALSSAALDESQKEAAAALERARAKVDELRTRTWKAVTTAMLLAVLAALMGTAFIGSRLTRSLRRLSNATKAVAEGAFHEPLAVDTKDEVGALANSFNSMAVRLREIDETKEKFYATVSHELRSPLNAMQEAARLIETKSPGPLTAKQERLLGIFQKGTERLLRLVNEVLDLSRTNAGMLPVAHEWFGLDAAVRQAVDELRPQAEQQGVKLRAELHTDSARMLGDKDRVMQVVINLVGNALRFTPPGGSVTVRLEDTGSEFQVQVEDTGIGIPAALLPVIFDRFRQAHSGKGGTGLGLAIVKALVEAHGGHVTVDSQEGKGSRFTVSFPKEIEPGAARTPEAVHA